MLCANGRQTKSEEAVLRNVVECPDKWENRHGSPYCYHYSKEPETLVDAVTKCKAEGANLMTIHSKEELGWISVRASQAIPTKPFYPYWLGLVPVEYTFGRDWKWTDGEHFNKTELNDITWQGHAEFNFISNDGCVAIRNFKEIRAIKCGVNYGYRFICSQPAMRSNDRTLCNPHSTTNNLEHCYRTYDNGNNLTWNAAHKYCVSVGGVLATSTSNLEFLRNTTQTSGSFYYMIGLYGSQFTLDLNYIFHWTDGLMFTESDGDMIKWQPGEPSDITSKSCVAVTRTIEPLRAEQMQIANCSEKLPYYCKLNSEKKICNESNTVWSECQASLACVMTCTLTRTPKSVECTQMCHPGCICAEGYVREGFVFISPGDKCIPKAECPSHSYMRVETTTTLKRKYQPGCPGHSINSFSTGTQCYRLIKQAKNFASASVYCSDTFDGFLAVATEMLTQISTLLELNTVRLAFVGLRKHKLEDWSWGMSSQTVCKTVTTREIPWQTGSPSNDVSSTNSAAVVSSCEYPSRIDNCKSGVKDVSQDEEFPFVCQFSSESDESVPSQSSMSAVNGSNSSTHPALSCFLVLSLVGCAVLVWTHLRRQERFLLVEKAITSRLPTLRKAPRLDIDYASLLRSRSLVKH